MDITKLLVKEKINAKPSIAKENLQEKKNVSNTEDFNTVLNKQKHEIKEEKPKTDILEQKLEKFLNEDGSVNIEKIKALVEEIPEVTDEELEEISAEILALILILLSGLSDLERMQVRIPKNPDGTINLVELEKNIKDIKEASLKKGGEIDLGKVPVSEEEVNAITDVIEKVIQEGATRSEVKNSPSVNLGKLETLVTNIREFVKNSEGKTTVASIKEEITQILASVKGDEETSVENVDTEKDLGHGSQKKEDVPVVKEEKSNGVNDDKKLSSKEEKFLNSLISEENKNLDKFSINAFKTGFGRIETPKEVPVITKSNAVFDMIKTVKFMQTSALKELTVKIYPKDLGEITISISQEKDLMKANIKANTKDAYALLNNNLIDIKKNLEEQNIKIQEVNISLYNDDTTFYREGEEKRNSLFEDEFKNGKINGIAQEEEEETSIHDGSVNMLA